MKGGHFHKAKCPLRNSGQPCNCGQFSKDRIKLPYFYWEAETRNKEQDEAFPTFKNSSGKKWSDRFINKVRKELRKFARTRWLEKIKGVYEDDKT